MVRHGALGAMAPQRCKAASREAGQFLSLPSSSPWDIFDSAPSGCGKEGSGCRTAGEKSTLHYYNVYRTLIHY